MNSYVQQLMFRTSWGSHPPNLELLAVLARCFHQGAPAQRSPNHKIHAQSECKATTWTTPEGQIIDSKGPPEGPRDMLGTPQESKFMLGFAVFLLQHCEDL